MMALLGGGYSLKEANYWKEIPHPWPLPISLLPSYHEVSTSAACSHCHHILPQLRLQAKDLAEYVLKPLKP
jgi:hypothetical protein